MCKNRVCDHGTVGCSLLRHGTVPVRCTSVDAWLLLEHNMTMGFIQMNEHFIYIVWALMLTTSKSGWMMIIMLALLCFLDYTCCTMDEWLTPYPSVTVFFFLNRNPEPFLHLSWTDWLARDCDGFDSDSFIQVTVKIRWLFWALMLTIYWSRWMSWAELACLCAYMCIASQCSTIVFDGSNHWPTQSFQNNCFDQILATRACREPDIR